MNLRSVKLWAMIKGTSGDLGIYFLMCSIPFQTPKPTIYIIYAISQLPRAGYITMYWVTRYIQVTS